MTDVSRLGPLATAISTSSSRIRAYALEQARVTAEQEGRLRKLEVIPSPAPEPEWLPAPILVNPTALTLSNANIVDYGDGPKIPVSMREDTDYLISGAVSGARVELHGGRNIILKLDQERTGSPTTRVEDAYGLAIYGQTGITAPYSTVHIEDSWIRGSRIGQGIVINCATPRHVQVQRTRIEARHPVSAAIHTDGIQTYRGPYTLRLDRLTIRTEGVGLQTQPSNLEPQPVGKWDYRHVSVEQLSSAAYALWKQSGGGAKWQTNVADCWVKHLGNIAWANGHDPTLAGWNPGGAWANTGESWKFGLPAGEFAFRTSAG